MLLYLGPEDQGTQQYKQVNVFTLMPFVTLNLNAEKTRNRASENLQQMSMWTWILIHTKILTLPQKFNFKLQN